MGGIPVRQSSQIPDGYQSCSLLHGKKCPHFMMLTVTSPIKRVGWGKIVLWQIALRWITGHTSINYWQWSIFCCSYSFTSLYILASNQNHTLYVHRWSKYDAQVCVLCLPFSASQSNFTGVFLCKDLCLLQYMKSEKGRTLQDLF